MYTAARRYTLSAVSSQGRLSDLINTIEPWQRGRYTVSVCMARRGSDVDHALHTDDQRQPPQYMLMLWSYCTTDSRGDVSRDSVCHAVYTAEARSYSQRNIWATAFGRDDELTEGRLLWIFKRCIFLHTRHIYLYTKARSTRFLTVHRRPVNIPTFLTN